MNEKPIEVEIVQPLDLLAAGPSQPLCARAASMLSDPSTDNDEAALGDLADVVEEGSAGMSDQEDKGDGEGDKIKIKVEDTEADLGDDEDGSEDAEDELEEGVQGPKLHV